MTRISTASVGIICFFSFLAPAFGTTYYVSSSGGSDSNSGTSISSPWKTITKVNAGAYNAGDSILFKAGDIWSGSPNFSTALITPFGGSSGSPITYGSYGTGASPILDGGNTLPTLITISHDYITITGLQLQNATKTWITYSGTTGTTITYVTGKNAGTWGFYGYSDVGTVLIDHTTCTSDPSWTMIAWCFLAQGSGPLTLTNSTCDLRNLDPSTSHAACAQINGSSNAVIQYNYAYGGQQAFSIKPNSVNPAPITGGLIADNYAYQIVPLSGGDAEAIELTGSPTNPQSGVTVTRNVIVCKSGPGGTQDAIGHYYSSNDIVTSNVFVGACGTGNAVHISSSSSGSYYNNTFSGGPGVTGISVYAGSSVTAKNNIFDNFSTAIYCHSCASATEDYNLYNTNVATPINGAALGSHSITSTDPQFITSTPSTENDVKLQATSPAIGAGSDLGSSFRSILNPQGTTFPFATYDQSSAWMMGAFGYRGQTLTKIAGDNQSNAIDSVFPTPLQVSLKDSDGNAVAGAAVTFTAVAGSSGASGTFSSSATVTTDSTGSATAPDLTSNSTAGQFNATATHGALSATFTLTNTDAPKITLNPTSLSFGSQDVGTSSTAKTITLSNSSSGALAINSISILGTNAADFSQTSNCGTSVAAGVSCVISVTFSPQAAGARSASLTVTDDAADSPQTAALTGTGTGVAQVSLTPSSLTFASQNVNTTSGPQLITVSNGGSGALSISGITITGTNAGDFSQTSNCGSSLAPSASCAISVTFTPQAAGARSASVSVADNATGSPQTATLSGTGAGVAQVSLSPTALSFGNQNLNTTSTAQTITLTNAGTGALSITSLAITGTNATDFSQTSNCGSSVGAGASCTISVTFTPQAAGARSASVSVADNAAGSPHSAALSGTGLGVAQISLTPSSLAFGNQNVKTASAARAITLSNAGSGALSITSIAITGTNATDFSQTNTCGTSVGAGASCTISVTFTPQAAGARSASVTVADSAAGSPHSAALSGTGLGVAQISLTPSSLAFGNQNVKTASAARAITLSNAGSGALSISSIAITGTNTTDFTQTNTCGTTVAAGASCTISVTFTPQAAGARSASVTVTDSAAGSPHTAALSGTGIAAAPQVSLTPSSLAFGNQKVKIASAAKAITLSNTGSGTLSITGIAFTGTNTADFSQTNTCGTSVAAGGSCTISVKFTPQAAGARSASLSITDNATGSPHRETLSGTGIPVTLTPSTLAFGNQKVRRTSSARTITVANIGTTTVSITGIAFTGTNSGDFSQTNTCGTSVAAGRSCTISVKFRPLAAGARSASLSITDNAAGSPHTAALSGTGTP